MSSNKLVELASGIDAFYVSGHGIASPGLLEELERRRADAEACRVPVPIRAGDEGWSVRPHGLVRYRYCLGHERGLIGVTDKDRMPRLWMQPTSAFLHAVGVREALRCFEEQAEDLVPDVRLTASRVDVYSDWQGWQPTGRDDMAFLCRADSRNTRGRDIEWTGFEFGRRKTGITARIYDKTRQIEDEGYDWWLDVWGGKRRPGLPVVRVEFELQRAALRSFGLDTALEALEAAPGLWSSMTGDWLTFRTPTGDATRSRWPLAPEWLEIQAASFARNAVGLERIREGRQRGSLRKLAPMLTGYLAGTAAHLGSSSLEGALQDALQVIRDYEIRSGVTFMERVLAKRRILGLP
jgi:hypothetical protein